MRFVRARRILSQEGSLWFSPDDAASYVAGVHAVYDEMRDSMGAAGEGFLSGLTGAASIVWRPPYYSDMQYVAAATGIPARKIVLANHAYELSRLACSTRVDSALGTLRVRRTLDWELPTLGKHTYVVRHANVGLTHVTFPGLCGALTAMRDGEFSVVINAAPSVEVGYGWQPLLLARHVVEDCTSYDEAWDVLHDTPLTCGVFFTLVGTEYACVIERTHDDARVRHFDGTTPLVVTNHYQHRDLRGFNPRNPDSHSRARAFKSRADAYRRTPVLNEITTQYVEMTPSTGACAAWGVVV